MSGSRTPLPPRAPWTTWPELKAKGVDVDDKIVDEGYGLVTSLAIPGAGRLNLYQPRYPLPPDAG